MPSKSSTLPFQQSNQISSTKSTINGNKTSIEEQTKKNNIDIDLQSPTHQRRLPLPNKLTFEQNITNLIEKESPLLQSELLTAEHELSVLRSRLAVNEGVTAVTGTILESLKEQFEPHHKVDIATSPLDIYKHNLLQQSLAIQTSPMFETVPEIPESVEIHYDAQKPKSPCLVVKAKNSFWIAQSVPVSEAETQLKKFSSPVMKRATVKLPKSFDQTFLTDSDTEDEQIIEKPHKITTYESNQRRLSDEKPLTIENVRRLSNEYIQNLKQNETNWSTEVLAPSIAEETTSPVHGKTVRQVSFNGTDKNIPLSTAKPSSTFLHEKLDHEISPEDQRSFGDLKEQKSEMKEIRSPSFRPLEDQFEQFDDKIDEIYSIIDYLKNTKLTSTNLNNIHTKINDLKIIMSGIQLNKQDELRIEYELDELENLFRTINDNLTNQFHKQEDYSFIELFEQNVNELRRIIHDIKSTQSHPHLLTTIKSDEQQSIIEEIPQQDLTNQSKQIPHKETDWTAEQMAEYFHRGPDGQLLPARQSHPHLIPEDPVITREVFFEGDKSIQEKKHSLTHVTHLIPEDARISADNFYEGDIHRSLYHTENEKEKELNIHDKPLIPESPLISSDVFYEGDPQRSMFTERSSLTQTETPPSIDNLREIMSDLMLAASWSKKATKIDEQSTKHDDEMLAESFITTEQNYPTSSLCEIVHEIENFPLSSEKSSYPAIKFEERDTISPFSTQSPIIIHRAIVTRQETERWPQDETIIDDEQTHEEKVTTNELEKIETDIGQHVEDWTNSSHQRKEIYGEQYRPERKLSAEIPEQLLDQSETIEDRSSTDKETVIIPREEIEEEKPETEDKHKLEQRLRSEKIDVESPQLSEHEDEEEQYQFERKHSAESLQRIEPDQNEKPSTFQQVPIGSDQETEEKKLEADDEYHPERTFSSEKFSNESPQLSEHEQQEEEDEQPRYKPERQFSADKVVVEPSETIEHEEDQYERSSSDRETVITREEIEENRPETEDEYTSERKLSSGKVSIKSSQPSEHEEEIPESEDQYKAERQLSSEKIYSESPRLSERDEEEDQHQDEVIIEKPEKFEEDKTERKETDESEQKLGNVTFIVVSAPSSPEEEKETYEYEHKFNIEPSQKSDEETEEKFEQKYPLEQHQQEKDQHKYTIESSREMQEDERERKLSIDEIVLESPHESEHEKEEEEDKHLPESEFSTDQIISEPSQKIEQEEEQYERFSTSEQASTGFDQQIEEDPYKLQSQHEFERSSNAEKGIIESPYEDEITPETSEKLQYPYESTLTQDESFIPESSHDFEREISDDNLQSASFHEGQEEDGSENKQLKRPQEWTRSSFQRDEIYGDKYRPTKYHAESPEIEIRLPPDYEKPAEYQSPVVSHVQRSNIISRTIASYPDEEESEEPEESDFRPTHLDISIPNETVQTSDTEMTPSPSDELIFDKNNQYEKLLYETSINIVNQILNDAIREILEQENNFSLYQTATGIVNDVIDNIYTKYDDEIISSQREEATSADVSISDLTDWSSLVKNVPDTTIQEKPLTTTSSGSDHEEEQRDVVTSKSTEKLDDFVQELQLLEQQINENVHNIRSSSPSAPSSLSENDEIHHYDLNVPQITTILTNEEQTTSSKSINELDDSINELKDTTQLSTDSLQQEEILQSTNIETLSQDIIRYHRNSQSNTSDSYSHRIERRPSSPPTSPLLKQDFLQITCSSMNDVDQVQQQLQQEEENKILRDMIDMIIRQAQENIQSDVSIINKNISIMKYIQSRSPRHQPIFKLTSLS